VIGAAAETLKDAGFEVLTAATGAEALSLLSSETEVDLLFTDVMMPGGMDGVRLAEAGMQVRPGLKVLLTSGYAETLARGQADLGGLPILAKPYRRDELLGRLQALMRASEGGSAR
jgi:CheY-like chemotaxis protein